MEANIGSAAPEAIKSNPTPAKKSAKSKAKQQKSLHPATSAMVTAAIKALKDRKGSSLQAIKKYIVATYKVDAEKVAPFIKRYLKSAVSSGTVVQTKGTGASGSFKLSSEKAKPKAKVPSASKPKPKKAKSVEKKTTTARKPAAKKPAKKAAAKPKKQPAQKKAASKPASSKAKAASEAKALSKAKKAVKAPAAKTKAPKPKKAAAKSVKPVAKK